MASPYRIDKIDSDPNRRDVDVYGLGCVHSLFLNNRDARKAFNQLESDPHGEFGTGYKVSRLAAHDARQLVQGGWRVVGRELVWRPDGTTLCDLSLIGEDWDRGNRVVAMQQPGKAAVCGNVSSRESGRSNWLGESLAEALGKTHRRDDTIITDAIAQLVVADSLEQHNILMSHYGGADIQNEEERDSHRRLAAIASDPAHPVDVINAVGHVIARHSVLTPAAPLTPQSVCRQAGLDMCHTEELDAAKRVLTSDTADDKKIVAALNDARENSIPKDSLVLRRHRDRPVSDASHDVVIATGETAAVRLGVPVVMLVGDVDRHEDGGTAFVCDGTGDARKIRATGSLESAAVTLAHGVFDDTPFGTTAMESAMTLYGKHWAKHMDAAATGNTKYFRTVMANRAVSRLRVIAPSQSAKTELQELRDRVDEIGDDPGTLAMRSRLESRCRDMELMGRRVERGYATERERSGFTR